MCRTHSSDCTELHSTANQSEIEHPYVSPTFGDACGYVVKYLFKSSTFFSKHLDLFHFKPIGNSTESSMRNSHEVFEWFNCMIVLAYGIY